MESRDFEGQILTIDDDVRTALRASTRSCTIY